MRATEHPAISPCSCRLSLRFSARLSVRPQFCYDFRSRFFDDTQVKFLVLGTDRPDRLGVVELDVPVGTSDKVLEAFSLLRILEGGLKFHHGLWCPVQYRAPVDCCDEEAFP